MPPDHGGAHGVGLAVWFHGHCTLLYLTMSLPRPAPRATLLRARMLTALVFSQSGFAATAPRRT
eukprot:2880303-Alexandrium_andersonii.AAC.1